MPKRASLALCGAAGAVALLILTWFLAFHVGFFHRLDARILSGFTPLDGPRVDPVANAIAQLCNPKPFVVLSGALLLIAMYRRRIDLALVIAMILLGANVTTHLLKPLLAVQRPALPGERVIGAVSWPSGHATAAMSLALCLVIVVPARLRPAAAALGAAFAVAVSFSFLTLGWHYPSDVLGGYLMAGAWTLLGVAVLFTLRDRSSLNLGSELADETAERPSLREALRAPAAALAAAIGAAGLIFLVRPHEVVSYAQYHRTFVVGAVAIAAMGLGLVTAVMLALRR